MNFIKVLASVGFAAIAAGIGIVVAARLDDAAIATLAALTCGIAISIPIGFAVLAVMGRDNARAAEPDMPMCAEPDAEPETWTVIKPSSARLMLGAPIPNQNEKR